MKTLYQRIGEQNLIKMVDFFYDTVFYNSTISHLFNINDSTIREKQFLFLTQFLGGPELYSAKFGHPKMKNRHLSHSIGESEKDEWLRCMKLAIDHLNLEPQLAIELYNVFPRVAEHMRNK